MKTSTLEVGGLLSVLTWMRQNLLKRTKPGGTK
jgi:hypothetical protein